MRRARRKYNQQGRMVNINEGIKAPELRIIDDEKGNLGVLPLEEALRLAKEAEMDLIEISPDAKPPVAKIMDYGKFMYGYKKKMKETRAKVKAGKVEVKNVQVKVGTGDNDMRLKAKKAAEWLEEGQRVKCELYLRGRSKYMPKEFLESKLEKFLEFVKIPHVIVEPAKKAPKGLALIIEADKKALAKLKREQEKAQQETSSEESSPEETPDTK